MTSKFKCLNSILPCHKWLINQFNHISRYEFVPRGKKKESELETGQCCDVFHSMAPTLGYSDWTLACTCDQSSWTMYWSSPDGVVIGPKHHLPCLSHHLSFPLGAFTTDDNARMIDLYNSSARCHLVEWCSCPFPPSGSSIYNLFIRQ